MNNALRIGKQAMIVTVVAATILWAIGFAAIAPLTANAASAGDLIKASGPAVYYYGSNGKRYVFPNEATYKTWYSDFSSVKTITDAELAAIPIGGNVTYKSTASTMRAVKITTSPTVYAVTNGGILRAIPDEATAASLLGSDWNKKIHDVPDAFFTNYTPGDALASGAALASLAAASADISSDKGLTAAPTTPVAAAGALTLSLAADAPASASAPYSSGDIIFSKVLFSGSGKVKQVKVTRSGLSADTDLSNVKLYHGTKQLGSNQTLDANHQATFVLSTPWEVSGSATLTIAADVAATGTAISGNVVQLGLNAAGDVVLDSGTVGGTFPLKGNGMSISAATIGSLTLGAAGGSGNPTSDATIDAGSTSILNLLEARLTAGATEDVEITSIAVLKGGTHVPTDLKAIELYDSTNAKVLASVTGWDADSRATFDLSAAPLKLTKGNSINLMTRIPAGGVIAGASRTISARFEKSGTNFVGIRARGLTYNIGLVATGAWAGTATVQTINAGSVTFVKSASTPATGNIAPGATNEKLGAWDVVVKGEDARSTNTTFTYTLGTMTISELTSCQLRNASGVSVAGPVDPSGTTGAFTTTITYPVGTNTYSLHCNIATTVSANDTVAVQIIPSTQTTLTGVNSGNSITGAPATAVAGNTLTVQAGALTVVNRTTPVAASIVPGAQKIALAEFGFDTSASGEDVRVTSLVATDTMVGAGANIADWANLRLTAADGTTLLADINQPVTDAASVTFTLSTPLVIPKKSSAIAKLFGDYKSGIGAAAETHTWRVNAAAGITAAGVTTGATVTPTMSPTAGSGGQAMTYSGAGTITTSADASSPVAGIVVAGKTGVTATVLKLVGANESIRVKSVKMTLAGSAASADVAKVYLYDGETKLGEGYLSADTAPVITFNFEEKDWRINDKDTKRLTVKIDVNNTNAGATSGNNMVLSLAATTDLVATGLASGTTVNATAAVTGNAHHIRKTKPVFTKNVGNTTVLTPGVQDVFLLDITADAAADVIFDVGTTGATYAAGEGMLNFTVSESGTMTGGAASLIRKSNNTTLSSLTIADGDARLVFNFEDVALTVAAGTTETIIVRVDTTGLGTAGNSFGLTLSSDTSATISATVGTNPGDKVRWNDDAAGGASDYNGFGLTSLPLTHTVVKG